MDRNYVSFANKSLAVCTDFDDSDVFNAAVSECKTMKYIYFGLCYESKVVELRYIIRLCVLIDFAS